MTFTGYVGSPQPHWWKHIVTLTDAPNLTEFAVTLFPAYGSWRAKASWQDADGRWHDAAIPDLATEYRDAPDDPMGCQLWLTGTIPQDD